MAMTEMNYLKVGGMQVVTGDVPIVKDSTDNIVNVGFKPDIIFIRSYGGSNYHTNCSYIKDSSNPNNYFVRDFYNPTVGANNNIGAIQMGTTPSYPNYAYLFSITSTGFTFRAASGCTDTTMHYMAIKLS